MPCMDPLAQVYPPLLTVSFLLVLVGYGTKAGLAPMHTWLPDAHSESPSACISHAIRSVAKRIHARHRSVSWRRAMEPP